MINLSEKPYFENGTTKWYKDEELTNFATQKIHRDCELFNNAYLSLQEISKRLAKTVKETEEKIEEIILKYYTL